MTVAGLVRCALGVAALLVVSGCNRSETPAAEAPPADVVATVNQRFITATQLEAFMELRRQDPANPAAREAALTELIEMRLLAEEASSSGLADPRALAAAQIQEWSFLANLVLSDVARSQPITAEEIQTEYERQIAVTGGTEYKLRHRLYPNQLLAAEAVGQLARGQPFASLSGEAGVGEAGSDLGWVNLAQVPAAFTPALKNLRPGQFSPAPIASEYGWHVIFLEETREFAPPPLEQVEEGIRTALSRRRLEEHMAALRQASQITRQAQDDVVNATAPQDAGP